MGTRIACVGRGEASGAVAGRTEGIRWCGASFRIALGAVNRLGSRPSQKNIEACRLLQHQSCLQPAHRPIEQGGVGGGP